MSGKIFICYRRGDSPASAGRLFDRLEDTYPRQQLFLDVDGIEPGQDFVQILDERVSECDVMLVIIGRQWLSAVDEAGKRRVDDPFDFVCLEISKALERGIRTIPILVDEASLPAERDLPPPLKRLARRQAIKISHDQFALQAGTLLKTLTKLVPPDRPNTDTSSNISFILNKQDTSGCGAVIRSLAPAMQNTRDVYVGSDIPKKKEYNARTVWGIPEGVVFYVLFDYTVFGSAKDFMAVCDDGIYYRHMSATPEKCFVSYKELLASPVSSVSWLDITVGGKRITCSGGNKEATLRFLEMLQNGFKEMHTSNL
jgi:hypothetical protein